MIGCRRSNCKEPVVTDWCQEHSIQEFWTHSGEDNCDCLACEWVRANCSIEVEKNQKWLLGISRATFRAHYS